MDEVPSERSKGPREGLLASAPLMNVTPAAEVKTAMDTHKREQGALGELERTHFIPCCWEATRAWWSAESIERTGLIFLFGNLYLKKPM